MRWVHEVHVTRGRVGKHELVDVRELQVELLRAVVHAALKPDHIRDLCSERRERLGDLTDLIGARVRLVLEVDDVTHGSSGHGCAGGPW